MTNGAIYLVDLPPKLLNPRPPLKIHNEDEWYLPGGSRHLPPQPQPQPQQGEGG